MFVLENDHNDCNFQSKHRPRKSERGLIFRNFATFMQEVSGTVSDLVTFKAMIQTPILTQGHGFFSRV